LFFNVKTSTEVFKILEKFEPLGDEMLPLEQTLGRVLSRDIIAQEDLPGFSRATMDGYAVRARDTFGATESLPALLDVTGEVIMGQIPAMPVGPGQAVRISTGGMLPENADGVAMVEYCHSLDENTIEVSYTISHLENVIQPGDDLRKGTVILKKGAILRPQDLGVIAGLGQPELRVYKRPKVAIISTGDEVIPIEQNPAPGQIRDINRYSLSALCRQAGAEPISIGLCPDNFEQLRSMVEQGLRAADTVWISGGSSVGTRDLTLKVFESFDNMELLVHGISVRPGKPTIIARINSTLIVGLPGHVASAMIVAQIFLAPFIARLSGWKDISVQLYNHVKAELSRGIESASGRDDYIRIKLDKKEEKLIANPIFGKAGLISTLVEADGLIKIDRNTEGLYQGEDVEVILFNPVKGEFH